MSINLLDCDKACHGCIKKYIKKHQLKKGESFETKCSGIPEEYVPDSVAASLGYSDKDAVVAMVDPVTWAAKFLDWHCLDPEGKNWKRKTEEGTLGGLPPYNAERAKMGKSIFHRPYQAEMLRCTANRKIFRIGRQSGKTETLCIMIAYSLFTNERFAIQVIAPFQSQIDLIFGRISDLINSNATLKNSESRNVKAPNYKIVLKNGSYVVGFTAGTRSGQDAGSSRGQHANMLVFDEADYLSPKDIDAALAVIINYPNATVWMSSTPTGRREKFYESCHNKQYKEFHYASYVNPNWTPELEAYFRSELTEDGYKHEIEAEFGEQEEGVYQFKYVEAAQGDFEYDNMSPSPTWTYMIGVDWNDVKIGTTIAVIGYNPQDGMFYLVDKDIVSRAERTQLTACQRIAEMNRLWNPESIYVDKGYGATQIEVLKDFGGRAVRQHGPNHPDSRLRNIVKGYDFAGTIEIRDLFTKQPVKKPAKPFLVENSVRRFEQLQFKYPKSDIRFTEQLLGYIVARVTMSGRPVYEAQNEAAGDHFLDAVNLAFVAFALEKTEFGKPSYTQSIAMAGQFGDPGGAKNNRLPVRDRNGHKPKSGRADLMQQDQSIFPGSSGDLPAANTNVESGTKIWSYPGFGHDGPKPKPRTLREAFNTAAKRVGINKSRRRRPKRTKF
jgi:replicative DNA helicase